MKKKREDERRNQQPKLQDNVLDLIEEGLRCITEMPSTSSCIPDAVVMMDTDTHVPLRDQPQNSSSSVFAQDMAREQMQYLRDLQACGVTEVEGIPIEILLGSDDHCVQQTSAARDAMAMPVVHEEPQGDGFDYLDPPCATRDGISGFADPYPAHVEYDCLRLPDNMVVDFHAQDVVVGEEHYEGMHACTQVSSHHDEEDPRVVSYSCTCRTAVHDPSSGCLYQEAPPVSLRYVGVESEQETEAEDEHDEEYDDDGFEEFWEACQSADGAC